MRLLATFAAAVCLGWTPAAAQEAEDAVTRPVWLTAPPEGALPFPFSPSDYRGQVALACQVAGETLADCTAVDATPESFLGAARNSAGQARIGAQDAEGRPTAGRPIVVTVRFPVLGGIMSAPPAWEARPTAEDFARYYPPGALAAGVSGRALLNCIVAADGSLGCTVLSEDPAGQGFGEAAVNISRHFRMARETRDGTPTAGGRVRLPIRFQTTR